MADSIEIKLQGVDELVRALREAPDKIRKQAVRGALRKAGRLIATAAKAAAPVLKLPTKTRNPGTIKRAIRVGVSKFARRGGDEGVFIGVRPLSGARQKKLGKAGAMNPNDPYYWPWVEFGHRIVSRGGGSGYGVTTYTQRLRDGRIVTRYRRFQNSSITGRRRASSGFVPGRFFMTGAAQNKGQEAIAVFMREAIPQIEKLTAKAARVR